MKLGCRVLSIERDPQVRTALTALVPAPRYQLIQTHDAQSGLEALEWVGAHIVLLDPGLTSDAHGVALVKWLVSLREPPLVVFLDRTLEDGAIQIAYRLGAKTPSPAAAGEVLTALLDRAHSC